MQNYLERNHNGVVWAPTFKRNLSESEERQFCDLRNILSLVFVPEEGQDSIIWAISKDGTFSVS